MSLPPISERHCDVLKEELSRLLELVKVVKEMQRDNPGPGWDAINQRLQEALEEVGAEIQQRC